MKKITGKEADMTATEETHPELAPRSLPSQIIGVLGAAGMLLVVLLVLGVLGLGIGECPRC